MSSEKDITKEQILDLEKQLLNRQFEDLEISIEKLNDKNFNQPSVKIIYATSKSIKESRTLKDKKIAFKIFVDLYKLNENYKQGLYNACVLCFEIKEYSELLYLIKKFINKNEYDKKVYEALYKIYAVLGDVENAVIHLKKIVELEPNNLRAWSSLIFCLNYLEDYNQKEYIDYAKNFSENIEIYDEEKKSKISFIRRKKIRIGLLTPYFNGNSIGGFLKGFLKNIDKNIFEIVAFNLSISDLETNDLRLYFDEWYYLNDLSNLDMINFIRDKNINILIDLVGHGPGNKLCVLKNRVAPVQISWLGYCNSSGLKEIDYIVADYNLIKPEEKNLYSEKILYLPQIWNSHEEMSEKLTVNDLPFYKNNYFTFGSFNNFKKISRGVIDVWSEIIKETEAKLILKSSMHNDLNLQNNLLIKFPKKLVRDEKIIILNGQRDSLNHLKMYNEIDLGLDTFPYNGVTTSFEAAWMGVPTLTILGNNFVSRTGESINKNLGLNNFIATNKDDYIKKAIDFSNRTTMLRGLRKNLRKKSKDSPLFKNKEFTKNFSEQLKKVWEKKLTDAI